VKNGTTNTSSDKGFKDDMS